MKNTIISVIENGKFFAILYNQYGNNRASIEALITQDLKIANWFNQNAYRDDLDTVVDEVVKTVVQNAVVVGSESSVNLIKNLQEKKLIVTPLLGGGFSPHNIKTLIFSFTKEEEKNPGLFLEERNVKWETETDMLFKVYQIVMA